MVRPKVVKCAACAKSKVKCQHIPEKNDDCNSSDKQEQSVSFEKKRKMEQPSLFVPEDIKRQPSKVCNKNAKRRQTERRYTADEVKVMLEER